MTDISVEVTRVWKKFHRGEFHDSLRDFIPALAKRLVGRGPQRDQLDKGDFWAIKNLSFQLRRGEALGIIGPNGAGKSTLLKILSRILRPNRGQYRVNGRLRALIEVAAGFHMDLTGRENVYLNGSILGMKTREIDAKFDEIIDFAGIEAFISTPVKRYSSGMLARLGFSIAAHMDPEILLVDEVLSVGDAAFRAKCIRHMEELIRSDVSVIFISHNLEHVRRLCDRALVLDRGELRFAGDVEGACEAYYACFQDDPDTAQQDAGDAPGSVLSVKVLDETGAPSFRVTTNRPITLEICYLLYRPLARVGVIATFAKPGSVPMTGCSTVHDGFALPSDAGEHSVRLRIDALPFSAGDYLLSARLVDENGRYVDTSVRPCPLAVRGPGNYHWDVFLQHEWRLEE